jgi:hypothetical protein
MDSKRVNAFEKHWSFASSALAWFYVHNVLAVALTMPVERDVESSYLVRKFTEQLRGVLNDCQESRVNAEDRNWLRQEIVAPGVMWYFVYATLAGAQLGLLAPPPETDRKTNNSITSQAMSDMVRTLTDQLGLALLDWGVLPMEEYRIQRKESAGAAAELIESNLKKWHAVPPFPLLRT